jgi:hypothetical protein
MATRLPGIEQKLGIQGLQFFELFLSEKGGRVQYVAARVVLSEGE